MLPAEEEYVVVIRAGSRLRFDPEEQLEVKINTRYGDAVLTFRTRYRDEGFESPVPRELWIDARGKAPSLEEAAEAFTNAAMDLTTIISFCANGYAGECQFHLAFDNTSRKGERAFFEQFVQDERGLPMPSRRINPALVVSTIEALTGHEHQERIQRAMVQYVLALEHWKRGSEILSTAHLFMGMETLVRVVLLRELAKLGLSSPQELADTWNIPLKELDPTIRRSLLFEGDAECHKAAKRASDGIEHGFLSFTEVRSLAQSVRDKTAAYLRRSIIKLLDLPTEVEQGLLSHPYNTPIGTIGYVRYFRGELIAEHDQLAAEGQEYPLLEWKFGVQSFSIKDKKLHITFTQSMTPRLGDGVSLKPTSVEMYGPEGVIAEPANSEKVEPQIVAPSEDTKRDQILMILESIDKAVMNYASNTYFEVAPAEALILTIYSRCQSLYQAVLVLLKQGLLEEALLLGRSLWIDSLQMVQLARTEHRVAMMLGLAEENAKQTKKRLQELLKSDHVEDLSDAIKSIENQRQGILRYAKRIGLEKLEVPKPYQEVASGICSRESYKVLLVSEQVASRSLLASARKIEDADDRRIAFHSHSYDPELLGEIGGFSAEAVLMACRAISTIFGWQEMEGIDQFLEQVSELWQ